MVVKKCRNGDLAFPGSDSDSGATRMQNPSDPGHVYPFRASTATIQGVSRLGEIYLTVTVLPAKMR